MELTHDGAGNLLDRHGDIYAKVAPVHADAAIEMLYVAWRLNNARRYTASAREMAKAGALPGFAFSNGDGTFETYSGEKVA